MGDAAAEKNLALGGGDDDEANLQQQIVDDGEKGKGGEADEENQHSESELAAMDKGWRPKEEWEGDPDDWRPAKQFLEWGEMRSTIKNQSSQINGMKKSYTQDISNLNAVHKKQLEIREKQIKSELKAAIKDGNEELAEELITEQGEIAGQKNSLDSTGSANVQNDAVIQGEWEENNPWIFDATDPRAAAAHSAFNLATSKGITDMSEKLAFVDERVQKLGIGSGRVNQNRHKAGNVAGSSVTGNGNKGRKLTMNDITSDESQLREIFADGPEGDKLFLKSIENMRKGE